MGVSINGVRYDLDAVAEKVTQEYAKQHPDRDLLISAHPKPPAMLLHFVAKHFGLVDGRNLYTVSNEYYEDYSPADEFMRLISRYYDLEDFYVLGEGFAYGANADEVADELGIELSEEEDEEW